MTNAIKVLLQMQSGFLQLESTINLTQVAKNHLSFATAFFQYF
jgi:hypothetical protein